METGAPPESSQEFCQEEKQEVESALEKAPTTAAGALCVPTAAVKAAQHSCYLISQKSSGGEGGDWREAWGITCYLVKCDITSWQCETGAYTEESKQADPQHRMLKVQVLSIYHATWCP